MGRLILHIGLFKTATTFLQEDVFPRMRDYHYVEKGLYRHTLLKTLLLTDYLVFKEQVNEVRRGFMDLMGGKEDVILSHEIFSGNPYFQSFSRSVLLDKLFLLFPGAKVIFVFRGQKLIIDSLYREYVVQGGTKRFEDFVFNRKRLPRSILDYDPHLDLETFKYGAYVDYIHECFGPDRVFVFPYERLKKDHASLMKDLLAFMETDQDPTGFPRGVRREGLNDLPIEMLRRCNRIFRSAFHPRGWVSYRPRFSNAFRKLNRLFSGRTPFAAGSPFPVDYTRDNDYLDEKYGFSLRRDFDWAYYS